MADVFYELSTYFPEVIKNLSGYDAMLLRNEHFETESCGGCSKHNFYSYDEKRNLILNENGIIHGCSIDDTINEIDFNPGAETLKAVDALKWWFDIENKQLERPSFYLERRCGGYDGKNPYSEVEIIDFIKKRNKLIKKLTGFDKEDDIPYYYFKNLAKSELIDSKKLEFGSLEHIAMLNGERAFSENLYKKDAPFIPSGF